MSLGDKLSQTQCSPSPRIVADIRCHRVKLSATGLLACLLILFAALTVAGQNESLDGRLERAAALIRENQLKDAEEQLSAILKTAPNEARGLNLLGTIRAQQGRLHDAEVLFVRALHADNRLIAAHMNLAYLYLLKETPDKTISELKEVVRLDPNNAEATTKLAGLLLSRNEPAECIALIEQLKKSQSPPAAILVILGDAYLKEGNAAKAEESYLLALRGEMDDTDAVLGLAQVAQFRGDVQTASAQLARARKLVVNSPATLYRFALVAIKAGAFEEANAALTQAVKLRPNDPSYFLALGTTWLYKPDLIEAEKSFRRALDLQPDSPRVQLSLGYTLLLQKRNEEARQYLERSIQKDPNTPEAFYYLGLIAQDQGEDERAVKLFEKASQVVPAFPHGHIALGSIYLKARNYTLARQELELGARLDPNDSKAHYNLARLYARLNDPQRAKEEMRIVDELMNARRVQGKESDLNEPAMPKPR